MKEKESSYILVVNRKAITKVYIDEIVYIESLSRKIYIYTDNGMFSEYEKLDGVEKLLPPNFYRCHKRCMVNLDKIKSLGDNTVYFENDSSVIMCKEKFRKLKQTYMGHAIRKNYYLHA